MVCFVRVSRTLLAENESVRKESPVVNMKTLLLRFKRPIYTIGGIMFLVMLVACSLSDDASVSDVQQTPTETVVPEKSQTTAPEPPSFNNYKDYID